MASHPGAVAFSVGGLADPITIDPRAITNHHRFITGDADIDLRRREVAMICETKLVAMEVSVD
jgi:hypothetical protein